MNQKKSINSRQLVELLNCLRQIGMESHQVLIFLAEIIHPGLTKDKVIPSLQKMFQELPHFFQQTTAFQLQKLISEPPADALSLRLLLDFRELQYLLHQVSFLQLLHLTNNILPPGHQLLQLEFLQKIQEQFQQWDQEALRQHHQALTETPLHFERQLLLQREPNIPWELLHFLIELLKLPEEELFSFQEWISQLNKKYLLILIKLLQLEQPSTIFEIKRRLDLALTASGSNESDSMEIDGPVHSPKEVDNAIQAATPMQQQSIESTISPAKFSMTASTDALSVYQLRIMRHPPSRTVYQRILKPFPSVMVVGGNADAPSNNLFVEAALLRSDSDLEIPLCIEGTRIVRVQGAFALFKKLKILSTTQQQGTLFRLRFTLKKYVGNVFETIAAASIVSNPIEVFSHTLYLADKQEAAPAPPAISEVLPTHGGPGTRVVILGSNFVNSPQLRVRFGDVEINCSFHEQGTLICQVPAQKWQTPNVPIRVTNDGHNYCDTKVFFVYVTHPANNNPH